jgi:hypothetical protein
MRSFELRQCRLDHELSIQSHSTLLAAKLTEQWAFENHWSAKSGRRRNHSNDHQTTISAPILPQKVRAGSSDMGASSERPGAPSCMRGTASCTHSVGFRRPEHESEIFGRAMLPSGELRRFASAVGTKY